MLPFWATCCDFRAQQMGHPCSHTLTVSFSAMFAGGAQQHTAHVCARLQAGRSGEAVKASLLMPIAAQGPAKVEHTEAHRLTLQHHAAMPGPSCCATCSCRLSAEPPRASWR